MEESEDVHAGVPFRRFDTVWDALVDVFEEDYW